MSAQWAKILVPSNPLQGIRKHVQQRKFQFIQFVCQRLVKLFEPRRNRLFLLTKQLWTAINNLKIGIVLVSLIGLLCCTLKGAFYVRDKRAPQIDGS